MAQTNIRISVAAVVCFTSVAFAQNSTVITPSSSVPLASDFGVNSHTNIHLLIPAGTLAGTPAASGPPYPGYLYQTPASIACIYGLVPTPAAAAIGVPGCNPNTVTANPTGGSKTIAIVDAYDDPTAANDIAAFSAQFGLPSPNFEVVYATGTKPPQDITGGWEGEESLDIEWSHAMAPNAKIILVEAASNSNANLFAAVKVASQLVAAAGGGEVSMSWGGAEFKLERLWDSYLQTPGVVYFASAGDSPGVEYPAASPYVVSAGGTGLSMNLSTGNFQFELAWEETGGGPSVYEPLPSYQKGIAGLTSRGTPDISFDADENTGVWIYDSTPWYSGGEVFGGPKNPWLIVYGTSIAAPSLAGVVNSAGKFAISTNAELTTVYTQASTGSFTDVTFGACGPYDGYIAGTGYDLCTGLGSPFGYSGK